MHDLLVELYPLTVMVEQMGIVIPGGGSVLVTRPMHGGTVSTGGVVSGG